MPRSPAWPAAPTIPCGTPSSSRRSRRRTGSRCPELQEAVRVLGRRLVAEWRTPCGAEGLNRMPLSSPIARRCVQVRQEVGGMQRSGRLWDVSPGLGGPAVICPPPSPLVPGTGGGRAERPCRKLYFHAWPLSGLASPLPSGARSVTVTSIVSGDVLAIGGGACDDLVERPSRGFFETAILLAVR